MSSSILANGGMTWDATLIVPQAMEWGISIDYSATSMNYGMLLQGFISTFMVLGATLSNNYDTLTAFRSLQGLFGTVPQAIGLPIIHNMYDPEVLTRLL
ncbi:hypothetical protein N8T08_008394 [Aspergillus melleus]|uniref:Uncharacterized protein n=1 Tax=Aspergillus melleus TaxID=138277 RepID=A0ACC3AW66_9EURO|nr:hypothetical protein N8T08_008394 [Aspergillus melleus]